MSCLAFQIPQYARLHPPSLIVFFWQISKTSQAPKHSLHSKYVWAVFGYKSALKVWQLGREGEEFWMISHFGWVALSLKNGCVCVVENLSRVFLFKWSPLHLWVIRVCIVWVKGKKITFKNSPSKMFCDYLLERLYPRDTCETDSLVWLFSF